MVSRQGVTIPVRSGAVLTVPILVHPQMAEVGVEATPAEGAILAAVTLGAEETSGGISLKGNLMADFRAGFLSRRTVLGWIAAGASIIPTVTSAGTYVSAYQGRRLYEWDGKYLSQYQGKRLFEWDGRYLSQYQGRRLFEWDGRYISEYQGRRLFELDGRYVREYQGSRLFEFEGKYVVRYQGARVFEQDGSIPAVILSLLATGRL